MVAPSGEQFEIRHGDQRAVAVEVGGGLRTYSVGDRAVLDGYDVDAICDGARCHTLVPWPNRVQDGKWTWRGVEQQLALTEPEQHNAIHGLVRWMPWSVIDRSDEAVTLGCTSHPQPGYPWTVEVRNHWSLSDEGLAVETTIINHSDTAAPVAAGFHPYLTAGTPTIDTAVLTLPGETRLPTGGQQIPTGREPVAGTDFDFRRPRSLAGFEIDHTYTDLRRDPDGRCRLRLANPEGGTGVTVWVDEAYPYLEIFTGDALPDPARRRQGLGVEPMSAPPNAMATGESLVTLEPGQTWRGGWGIDPF
ncbi:MAG TPA: aldose 1-epimerase family protein [Mycobacteriales bacterium]|jgi:aldose 1-epimerase|nr:aldose 1-epimerase family protein [Mycobacteriales bacterium]